MNKIAGLVVLKDSGIGIPNLLVVVYDLDPQTQSEEPTAGPVLVPASEVAGDRLGSVLTDQNGAFALTYENAEFQVRNATEKRPDLRLSVLAPEEPGQDADSRVLYLSNEIRHNAGLTEHYLIRLSSDQLRKAGITPPSGLPEDGPPAEAIVGRLTESETRLGKIADGAVGTARQRMESFRARFGGFTQKLKPALIASLSQIPSTIQDPERFVTGGASAFQKTKATIKNGIQEILNSDDPRKRAPARGFISLTQAELDELRSHASADGSIPDSAVETVSTRNGQSAKSTFVQATDRLPLCQPKTTDTECARLLLDPPPQPTTQPPPTIPGPSVTSIGRDDIPRYLARLTDPVTAPEEELLTGLTPVATRETVQSSVQNLLLQPSPADVPAFHDFSSLQIAFEHVWQEAIDEGIVELAQDAYETIVELGGDPQRPEYQSLDPVRTLVTEGRSVLKAARLSLRDHRGEASSGGGVVVGPGSGGNGHVPNTSSSSDNCGETDDLETRDHRSGEVTIHLTNRHTASADPGERLPSILRELERMLLSKYRFTTYAANSHERSVNFGILNTYRQTWTPLSYQAGPLVKSIPLAPKQTQKLVITRKQMKKRSQKELEKNLRILRDESDTTNRVEQEIARRASTKNESSIDHSDAFGLGASVHFGQDATKSSDDVKKSLHERVFKFSQEVNQERTTEINTEETEEFESVETTEITNPNDEIAVTFLFYELQRRYRIYERLYRVQPVVLVAQEFPQPHEINEAWILAHDWILKRVILDDSFLPTLNSLCNSAGDESALAEMRANIQQQRCIVAQLREELASARSRATLQQALLERAVFQKAGVAGGGGGGGIGGLLSSAASALGDVAEGVGDLVFGGDAAQNQSNRQALEERAQAAAEEARDLMFRLEREVTALNSLTEVYAKALRDHHTHLTEIARLQVHVKENIFYYMQAIWSHEPRDQRFFRLHNVPVPVFTVSKRSFRVDFDHPISPGLNAVHQRLPRFGGRNALAYPVETTVKFNDDLTFAPLSQVADIDNLLGYKGNYMIFPLNESNLLTDFMMDPFVDRATGQLVDPSDPINWSIDEFSEYVCCLKETLTADEFAQLLPQLREQYQVILSTRLRNNDVLVVPTNSLFIEALPSEHSLIEKFKARHRAVDVKKVQAEVRGQELENLRFVSRLLEGEREDPQIDKKIVVEGSSTSVIVPTDNA